jgi:hypothetical protein
MVKKPHYFFQTQKENVVSLYLIQKVGGKDIILENESRFTGMTKNVNTLTLNDIKNTFFER